MVIIRLPHPHLQAEAMHPHLLQAVRRLLPRLLLSSRLLGPQQLLPLPRQLLQRPEQLHLIPQREQMRLKMIRP